MNEKDLPESTPDKNKQDEKNKEIEKVMDKTNDNLATLKQQVESVPVISTIVNSVIEKKDKIEPDSSLFEGIGDLIAKKEYGKALQKALGAISKLFSFKLQQGFNHLSSEKALLKLDEHIKNKNIPELEKYINNFEHELGRNMSISDKGDITHLMSECKDALYTIALENKGKDISQVSKFDYFKNALTNGEKESPIGKVILFNRGDFTYKKEQKLFDKAIQASSGSMWEHVAIVTGYDATTGEIHLTHARGKKGVYTSSLQEYAKEYSSPRLDLVTLDIEQTKRQQVINYVQQQQGKGYDLQGAAQDASKKEATSDDSKFYCSELIYKGLQSAGTDIEKKMIYPGQLLDILKPSYATTIATSDIK